MCVCGQSWREKLHASFQRGSGLSLVHSKSCMEKGLDGNLPGSCFFCLYLLLLKLWLKERNREIEVQLSGVSFWRNFFQ